MALGQRIELPSFELNAKPLDSLDIDERLPSILKLAHASHHAQLLATFFFYREPNKVYTCKHNEIASHIGEAR